MFSCCCARVDPTWYTVCDCYKGNSTCGNMCVEKAMDEKDMYFDTAQVKI
jgi:putative lipase involved disintegration of autophagic bodies